MYWYLREKKDSPQKLSFYIDKLRNTYVCKGCKGDLTNAKFADGHLGLWCKNCGEERYYADSKSRFEALPGKEQIEIAEKFEEWDSAPAKNLYEPNEKEFWYFLQPHMIRGISGGNRSGKTSTNVVDIVMQAEGWHPLQKENLIRLSKEALREDVRRHCSRLLSERKWIASPPVDLRIVAVDFPNGVEKIVGPEVEKWLTKKDVKYIGYANEKKRRIDWNNRSMCEFMSHDQDLDSHGGSARDHIYCDEELPQEFWTENMMRIISKRGRMTIGATAVNGVTWTENEIWRPGDEGHPDIYTIEMTTYDNPVNTPEIIERIEALCRDQIDRDIRIYGKRTLRGGHVYKNYQERPPHLVEVEA